MLISCIDFLNKKALKPALVVLFFLCCSLNIHSVFAACADPVGVEGGASYNASYKVVQFCDGDNWWATSKSASCGASAGGSGCTSPTAGEGEVVYNSSQQAMQFCNGTSWMNMGGAYNCPCQPGAMTNEQEIFATAGAAEEFAIVNTVASDGTYLLVGARMNDDIASDAGTVYVFDAYRCSAS